MGTDLRAVVIGAGWAGEGHTLALRHIGVDVVAVCARQPDVADAVAARLGVGEGSADWRGTLARVRPDIVSLATPASLRDEAVEAAVALGCHVLCEKPLAATAADARQLHRLVSDAGVRHAYAVTQRYDPSVAWLGELVRGGAVGALRAVTGTFRLGRDPAVRPWSWALVLASGGGMLNNALTHHLAILAAVLGGEPVRAMGAAHAFVRTAPVLPGVHDFRVLNAEGRKLAAEAAAALEWRDADAEFAYSAVLAFRSPAAHEPTGDVQVTLACGPGCPAPAEANGLRLYGEAGTLVADGTFSYQVSRIGAAGEPVEPMPVPQRLADALPQAGDGGTNKWAALARDFVADIRGEPHAPYPTFRDGWRYQEAIDAIRAGAGWHALPA